MNNNLVLLSETRKKYVKVLRIALLSVYMVKTQPRILQ